MLAVDANLTFFSGLTEHEMLSLDSLVDRFRAVHNLSGLPSGLVQVLVYVFRRLPLHLDRSANSISLALIPLQELARPQMSSNSS